MKITILSTIALVLSIGIEDCLATNTISDSACFTTGPRYNDNYAARLNARNACEGWRDSNGNHVRGFFEGAFAPSEFKNVCVNMDGGQYIRLGVGNLNAQQSFDLGDEDCTRNFKDAIFKCVRGSEHQKSGWVFYASPHNGRC